MSTVWVLVMMTVFQGEPATRMLGSFDSELSCRSVLVVEAGKRANLPHAQGGGSFYQCSPWRVNVVNNLSNADEAREADRYMRALNR